MAVVWFASSVYLSLTVPVPCVWVIVHVCHGCYTPVECIWGMYSTYSWVPHGCYMHLFPSLHNIDATCISHAYLMYLTCMPCSGCDIHTPYVLCVTVMCVLAWGARVRVLASDSSAQASRVQVAIQTLDENDNAPQLAEPYDTFVCDSAAPSQVSHGGRRVRTSGPPAAHSIRGFSSSSQLIQVIRALDRDEVGNNSRVSFHGPLGPDANFTVRDNQGG